MKHGHTFFSYIHFHFMTEFQKHGRFGIKDSNSHRALELIEVLLILRQLWVVCKTQALCSIFHMLYD